MAARTENHRAFCNDYARHGVSYRLPGALFPWCTETVTSQREPSNVPRLRAETNTFGPRRYYDIGAQAGDAASSIFSGWVIRFGIRAGPIRHRRLQLKSARPSPPRAAITQPAHCLQCGFGSRTGTALESSMPGDGQSDAFAWRVLHSPVKPLAIVGTAGFACGKAPLSEEPGPSQRGPGFDLEEGPPRQCGFRECRVGYPLAPWQSPLYGSPVRQACEKARPALRSSLW